LGLIEMKAIDNLKEIGAKTGKDLVGVLIEMYRNSVPQSIESMRNLLESKDFESLGREAHSLKSSSANLGVSVIREVSKKIEIGILKNELDPEQIKSLILEIEKDLPQCLDELTNL